MRYLLLLHADESAFERLGEPEQRALMAEYRKVREELKASGHLLDASRLRSVTTATIVRIRDGKRLVTDGPFIETREQLGGYFLVEAGDLDAAIEMAARIPGAVHGSIEVRPLDPGPPPTA
jgi:hypothetical protein